MESRTKLINFIDLINSLITNATAGKGVIPSGSTELTINQALPYDLEFNWWIIKLE